MQLYTFSGTGNSLHAARALAARFPDASIVPVLRALEAGEVKTSADVVTRECFAKVFDDMDKLLARGASTSTPASPLRWPRTTSPFLRPSPGDPPPP
jgi:hypothetical protein